MNRKKTINFYWDLSLDTILSKYAVSFTLSATVNKALIPYVPMVWGICIFFLIFFSYFKNQPNYSEQFTDQPLDRKITSYEEYLERFV